MLFIMAILQQATSCSVRRVPLHIIRIVVNAFFSSTVISWSFGQSVKLCALTWMMPLPEPPFDQDLLSIFQRQGIKKHFLKRRLYCNIAVPGHPELR